MPRRLGDRRKKERRTGSSQIHGMVGNKELFQRRSESGEDLITSNTRKGEQRKGPFDRRTGLEDRRKEHIPSTEPERRKKRFRRASDL